MALIEVCGKLIDTKLVFSGKAAIEYAKQVLEKELQEQKEKAKQDGNAFSIDYSQACLEQIEQENAAETNVAADEIATEPKEPALPEPSQTQILQDELAQTLDLKA